MITIACWPRGLKLADCAHLMLHDDTVTAGLNTPYTFVRVCIVCVVFFLCYVCVCEDTASTQYTFGNSESDSCTG